MGNQRQQIVKLWKCDKLKIKGYLKHRSTQRPKQQDLWPVPWREIVFICYCDQTTHVIDVSSASLQTSGTTIWLKKEAHLKFFIWDNLLINEEIPEAAPAPGEGGGACPCPLLRSCCETLYNKTSEKPSPLLGVPTANAHIQFSFDRCHLWKIFELCTIFIKGQTEDIFIEP